jgi:hypothetical protein
VRREHPDAGLFWRIDALLFGDMDNAASVDVGFGVGVSVELLPPHAADSTMSPPIKMTITGVIATVCPSVRKP